ncbi:MAG: hypothetical protein HFACDABA_02159 [Anaerolineales bacterium]|nr:hypothetical protein [Anaerolineales bacterium]
MHKLRLSLLSSLLAWSLACSLASIVPLTPTPTAYVFPTNTVVVVPALTVEQLQNAEYTLIGFADASTLYKFTDGTFTRGADPSAVDYADLRLLDFFPMGDLNEDGARDAAVLIAENYGGTGVFVSIHVVLNDNGQPRDSASYMIDDRPQINALEIRNGEIFLDAIVHDLDDPMCCPASPVTRAFRLIGNSLALVNASSQTPGGLSRVITIESPLDGQEVSGALVIRGNVTISPFENNLALRVYNENGNELFVGPVNVDAADLGAPGTFNVTLDLGAFPPGRIRIELSDLSAADGSVLALDSVMVIVR